MFQCNTFYRNRSISTIAFIFDLIGKACNFPLRIITATYNILKNSRRLKSVRRILPHVRILNTNHCGEMRRTAFKRRELFQDVLCCSDYSERVVASFAHQIQS